MFLTRRGEYIFMLIVNNLGGFVPFLFFFADPDAMWPKKALYVVIGLLFLTIGNRFVVKSWGPNSWAAQRELELEKEQAGERGCGHDDS